MKENSIKKEQSSIEEVTKIIERKIKEAEHYTDITGLCLTLDEELRSALMNILSDYKRVLKENELAKQALIKNSNIADERNQLLKENEEYKKQYFCLIDKIENKIDKFDYEFEKAKRKNDNDRANYYWDLIRNLKKLLESEE